MNRLERFERDVAPLQADVVAHRLMSGMDTVEELRAFCEHHVFAVWDFMSLLKAMQLEVTTVRVPWLPSLYPTSAVRFINEIVVGEESDHDPLGGYVSHFDLYLRGMEELGADTMPMRRFIAYKRACWPLDRALLDAQAPAAAAVFVEHTFTTIGAGLPAIVGAFAAGRERLIPAMFSALLARNGVLAPTFEYYLARHIEVDGDEHGPLCRQLLVAVCGPDPARWAEATAGARRALTARAGLWDGVRGALRGLERTAAPL